MTCLLENQIFSKFESKSELAGPAAVPANEIDSAIGGYIGSLVDSGATLQIGIGNIFSGVPDGLQKNGKNNCDLFYYPFVISEIFPTPATPPAYRSACIDFGLTRLSMHLTSVVSNELVRDLM